jgi:hypothetical protein
MVGFKFGHCPLTCVLCFLWRGQKKKDRVRCGRALRMLPKVGADDLQERQDGHGEAYL